MDFEIYPMEEKDIKEVASLESKCFKDAWNEDAFRYEFFDNNYSHQYVAKVGEKIVGYVIFWITFDSATLCKVCVDPLYRRNNIGRSLLDEMMDDVFANRAVSITLEVRTSNEAAINLYKKMGFEIVVTKPHYYSDGEDAYYMVERMSVLL